jgi:hypothetical protein
MVMGSVFWSKVVAGVIALLFAILLQRQEAMDALEKDPTKKLVTGLTTKGWLTLAAVFAALVFSLQQDIATAVQSGRTEKVQEDRKKELDRRQAALEQWQQQVLDNQKTTKSGIDALNGAQQAVAQTVGDVKRIGEITNKGVATAQGKLDSTISVAGRSLHQLYRAQNPFSPFGATIECTYPFSTSGIYPGKDASWRQIAAFQNGNSLKSWLKEIRARALADAARVQPNPSTPVGARVNRDPSTGEIIGIEFITKESPYFPQATDPDASGLFFSPYEVLFYKAGRSLTALPSRDFSGSTVATPVLNVSFRKGTVTSTVVNNLWWMENDVGGDIASIYDLPHSTVVVKGVYPTSRLTKFEFRAGVGNVHTFLVDCSGFPPPSILNPPVLRKELDARELGDLRLPAVPGDTPRSVHATPPRSIHRTLARD